ncbi:MAG: tRNA (adenosine(37)-N6)-dimethylallyltransferase MiaA [Firmicutes bacterium]|nr:tRNA (adenosine(37)-N6)-dimethylallyltransferase MiaA [Bacillota bacterium]
MDGADEKRPLLVIAGPTAVGKSDLSLMVAEAIGGEIISADSQSVYRGLDIGAAKVSLADRQRVRHHGIDVVGPHDTFSVADFQRLAKAAIDDITRRGHVPMLVGGTGLWIRAVVKDFPLPQEAPPTALRQQLATWGEQYGYDALRRQLRVVDPASYQAIQPNDHRRLIRALEVFYTTNRRLPRTAPADAPYQTIYWVLTRSIHELHRRIEQRVATMLQDGLVREVGQLLSVGVPRRAQSLGGIGYRETVDWYYGLLTASERDRLIVRHTQQYAKRQLTWFRSEKDARWLDLSSWPLQDAVNKIVHSVKDLSP